MSAFVVVRATYIALMLLLGIVDYLYLDLPFWIYVLPTLAFTGLLVAGTTCMSLNYFAKTNTKLPATGNKIALTFDDGPCSKFTPDVLDLLKEYEAKAAFFCIGKSIDGNESLIKRMVAEGHVVGNHSYSHSNFFPLLCRKKIAEEISRTNDQLYQILGEKCSIFRPPFGVMNPSIAWATKHCAMDTVGWNLRSYDGGGKSSQKVTERVIKNLKPGSVVLLHDNREDTVTILKQVLEYAKKNNYEYATVHDMF